MKHPVDVHVGLRIRQRRWMAGLTQQQLGEMVGIKFQQVQKYETGVNRVSASRLWDIARALSVPVSYFFDGYRPEDGRAPPATVNGAAGEAPRDLLADREAMELVRSYYAIPKDQRRRLFDLARVLSKAS
ncbi:MAG: helix-turn-helix transcriptional regulator [Pseudomonadota bacterium]